MSRSDTDDAALARGVRAALAQTDAAPEPSFERMWRNAAQGARQRSLHRQWPSPQRLRWMTAAFLLPALMAAFWLLRAPHQAPITDGELLQASADTARQVWRDPLASISAGIPRSLAEERIEWPRVQYPLIPEQRYL